MMKKYNPEKYSAPFRVGRSQGRAVMDSTGREVLLFHKGDEQMAVAYCDYLNKDELIFTRRRFGEVLDRYRKNKKLQIKKYGK